MKTYVVEISTSVSLTMSTDFLEINGKLITMLSPECRKDFPEKFWEILDPVIREMKTEKHSLRHKKTMTCEADIEAMLNEHRVEIARKEAECKNAIKEQLTEQAVAEKKEVPEILLRLAKEKHDRKGSLSGPGGYAYVDDVVAGDGFIVYKVTSKNWNPYGGERNSGITMAEGIYAFDGATEITIKPCRIYRDGENQHNDNWDNCHSIEAIDGLVVTLHSYSRRVNSNKKSKYKLDFNEGSCGPI